MKYDEDSARVAPAASCGWKQWRAEVSAFGCCTVARGAWGVMGVRVFGTFESFLLAPAKWAGKVYFSYFFVPAPIPLPQRKLQRGAFKLWVLPFAVLGI